MVIITNDMADLVRAIVDFDPEEAKRVARETDEPYTCLRCEDVFVVDVEHEPSPLCHGCAHEVAYIFAVILNGAL